jgi:two-component system, chemotaxis family, chemotaxis protein CheY
VLWQSIYQSSINRKKAKVRKTLGVLPVKINLFLLFLGKRLKEMFEFMGFKCVGEAADGLEALDLAEKLNPSLISLDILMPVMHGVESLGYLKEQGCKARIVFVSSLGNLDSIADLRSKGHQPDAIFSKKDSREVFEEVLWDIFSAVDSDTASKVG